MNKPFPHRKNRGSGPVDLTRFFKGDVPVRLDSPPLSWRVWYLVDSFDGKENKKVLGSVTAAFQWEGPTATTRKLPSGDLAKPAWSGRQLEGVYDAGIYSYKTPQHLIWYLGLNYPVYGRLENYRGVEHEMGYRSRIVTIQELWVRTREPQLAHELSNRYDCDVQTENEFTLEAWLDDQTRRFVK